MVGETIMLRGLRVNGGDARPTILQRIDQEFIPALLEELRVGGKALAEVADTAISPRAQASGELKLFQPVQRTFNVVVLESACERFGFPRVDPERIESAGLVVRRVGLNGKLQGWMQSANKLRGWLTFGDGGQSRFWQEFDPDADPDPQRRPLAIKTGHAEIDRLFKLKRGVSEPFSESVSPLFVAPPEVCQATGRTILYGLVPVTSAERSDLGATSGAPGAAIERDAPFDFSALEQKFPDHLPYFLKREVSGALPIVPRAQQTLTRANAGDSDLAAFTLALRQLQVEFDAFDARNQRNGTTDLLNKLNQLVFDQPDGRRLGDFLKQATAVLVDRVDGSITMPKAWPKVSEQQERGFTQAALAVLRQQLGEFTGGEGRFDDIRADAPRQYQLRAFVRIKREDGCPPKLVWSQYSEPFTIAPWYESGAAPPTQINLPDALNGNLLKSLKPNVAFVLPESLANVLNSNSPKAFIDGEAGKGGGGIGLDWICGFSIPLITICAFIVLNIFLQLFNIIFQWLFFIKICIPFPRKKG